MGARNREGGNTGGRHRLCRRCCRRPRRRCCCCLRCRCRGGLRSNLFQHEGEQPSFTSALGAVHLCALSPPAVRPLPAATLSFLLLMIASLFFNLGFRTVTGVVANFLTVVARSSSGWVRSSRSSFFAALAAVPWLPLCHAAVLRNVARPATIEAATSSLDISLQG